MKLYATRFGPIVLQKGANPHVSAPFSRILQEVLRCAGVENSDFQVQQRGLLPFKRMLTQADFLKVELVVSSAKRPQEPTVPWRGNLIRDIIIHNLRHARTVAAACS